MNSFGGLELLQELGRGGAAVVHRARDPKLGRLVALKILLGTPTREDTRRFRREARVQAQLQHEHLVRLYDCDLKHEPPFLVLELMEGGTLASVLENEGPQDPVTVLRLGRGLGDALAHLHAAGVTHRDLKPANVLLTAAGHPKVGDFGLSKRDRETLITLDQAVHGTIPYLAPEIFELGESSPPTDVYALGLVLYECLTTQVPHQGNSLTDWIQTITSDPPKPLTLLRGDLDPRVVALVMDCLRRDPGERPEAGDVVERCSNLLKSAPLASRIPRSSRTIRFPGPSETYLEPERPLPSREPSSGPGRDRPPWRERLIAGVILALILGSLAWRSDPAPTSSTAATPPGTSLPEGASRLMERIRERLRTRSMPVVILDRDRPRLPTTRRVAQELIRRLDPATDLAGGSHMLFVLPATEGLDAVELRVPARTLSPPDRIRVNGRATGTDWDVRGPHLRTNIPGEILRLGLNVVQIPHRDRLPAGSTLSPRPMLEPTLRDASTRRTLAPPMEALLREGRMLLFRAQNFSAERHYREALELHPGNQHLLHDLQLVYCIMGGRQRVTDRVAMSALLGGAGADHAGEFSEGMANRSTAEILLTGWGLCLDRIEEQPDDSVTWGVMGRLAYFSGMEDLGWWLLHHSVLMGPRFAINWAGHSAACELMIVMEEIDPDRLRMAIDHCRIALDLPHGPSDKPLVASLRRTNDHLEGLLENRTAPSPASAVER